MDVWNKKKKGTGCFYVVELIGGRVLNNKLVNIFNLVFIARSVIRGYIFSVNSSMSLMLELISSLNV